METKSHHGYRTIILPAVASAALHRQRAAQERERELAGTAWKGSPWPLVFTSTVGTPLFHSNVHKQFWQLLDIAGLRRIRPHDLRHSAAALLIAQGVHGKAIQELLGHGSVAFTLQVYGHLFDEAKRETADKMDSRSGSRGFHNGFHFDPEAAVVNSKLVKRLAPQVGLEPTTLRLTAGCSTN